MFPYWQLASSAIVVSILLLIAALCMMGIKGYGINLSDGYARCEKGQAELIEEQIKTVKDIIEWAKEHAN